MAAKWVNLGIRTSANATGIYHERIQLKLNNQGQITDMLNQPLTGAKKHGHAWNLNTGQPGIRYPLPQSRRTSK